MKEQETIKKLEARIDELLGLAEWFKQLTESGKIYRQDKASILRKIEQLTKHKAIK